MKPWECPRCRRINAPWCAQCHCPPPTVPATIVAVPVPAGLAKLPVFEPPPGWSQTMSTPEKP